MEYITNFFLNPNPYFIGNLLTDTCNVNIHIHNSFEIFLATTDNIRYSIEGSYYDLKKGDIIITNASEVHRPSTINADPCGRQFILFSPAYFEQTIKDIHPRFYIFTKRKKGYYNHLKPNDIDRDYISQLFNRIIDSYSSHASSENLLTTVLIAELLIHLERIYSYCYTTNKNYKSHRKIEPRVKSLLEDINLNYKNKISLDELANQHYMNKYYMCHLFKSETSFSIGEYINSQRIMHAKDLLENDKLSFNEIAQMCGFEDYSNFYKIFKKLMGASPSKYKNIYLNDQSNIKT
jgi:AraC-like DNA-binding protein